MAIAFQAVFLVIDHAEDFQRSLLWVFDLEEGVLVVGGSFAFFAKVEVRANNTLISVSNNWVGTTSVTNATIVHNRNI